MAETFYSTLGVDTDADPAAIRSAFREQVKDCHPDVSDDPGAPSEFKRLTTARDVLVDADERARYDRLGHDSYVRRHVETSVWEAEPDDDDGSDWSDMVWQGTMDDDEDDAGAGDWGSDESESDSARETWLGEDHETRSTATGGTRTRTERADGGSWWHASEVYRRTPHSAPTPKTGSRWAFVGRLGRLGPWAVVHVILLGSALATGWFTVTRSEAILPGTLPAAAVGLLLVAIVVCISILHLVSLVYG